MKRTLAIFCAFALVFSLAGCGGGSSGSASSPPAGGTAQSGGEQSGPVTLRLAWWGNQDRSDITMKIIEMYKEVAPNVTIEPEMAGWADYWTKLATQAGGSDMPDIMQMSYPTLSQYAMRGQLADMDALMDHFNTSGIDAEVLNAGVVDGVNYMIPTGVNAMSIIYDPAMFEQAEAMKPALDWTWEDYMDSARKIREKLGIYGATQFESTSDLAFTQYLNSRGFELMSPDNTSLGFDDPQLLADYFNMELELTGEGVIPGPDLYSQRLAWEESFMAAGEAPSIFVYANNLSYIQALTEGRTLEIGPPPATELGTAAAARISASMGFSIAENCRNKAEAMRFLDYFTNTLEVQQLEALERGIPISSTIRSAMAADLDEMGVKMFDYIDLISERCKVMTPSGDAASLLSTGFVEINEQVLYGVLSPEDGAAEYFRMAEESFAFVA